VTREPERLASVRRRLRRALAFHDELFMAPWRAGVQREARRQEDLLVALVFCEALGVENPAAYHTLELYPELVAAYHDWHRRQGLEHAPHPGVCC
jgi:uncharacterized protein YciW